MNTPMNIWTFPKSIEYSEVPQYLRRLDGQTNDRALVLDLSDTEDMHSAFIGFLIVAKERIEKTGFKLVLYIPPSIERILKMLNIFEYFLTHAAPAVQKKTA
jgi:anti-anti-sigma regulatory factor